MIFYKGELVLLFELDNEQEFDNFDFMTYGNQYLCW